jgi:hypothetical protein
LLCSLQASGARFTGKRWVLPSACLQLAGIRARSRASGEILSTSESINRIRSPRTYPGLIMAPYALAHRPERTMKLFHFGREYFTPTYVHTNQLNACISSSAPCKPSLPCPSSLVSALCGVLRSMSCQIEQHRLSHVPGSRLRQQTSVSGQIMSYYHFGNSSRTL